MGGISNGLNKDLIHLKLPSYKNQFSSSYTAFMASATSSLYQKQSFLLKIAKCSLPDSKRPLSHQKQGMLIVLKLPRQKLKKLLRISSLIKKHVSVQKPSSTELS